MSSATIASNKQGILEACAEHQLVVEHLPYYYEIHLSMPCNQRCIMCVPNGMHARDALSYQQFVAFFEQVRPYAEHIALLGGETFMYPQITDVLDLLSAHPIEVTLISNCVMLEERVTSSLLALSELNLKCSIDASTRETYRRIRGRDHFDRVTSNMLRFARLSRELPNIRMIPHYVVMRENLDEVLSFIDFAASLGVARIDFQPVANVASWHVENGTGWKFHGDQQSCQFFAEDYNAVMEQAAAKCQRLGVAGNVQLL